MRLERDKAGYREGKEAYRKNRKKYLHTQEIYVIMKNCDT